MNIEEIKGRLSNLEAGKIVRYSNTMNLATQYMMEYNNDVTYLLSIIEQQDKALELIANGNNNFPTWADTVDVLKDVRLVASEALQAIRGK